MQVEKDFADILDEATDSEDENIVNTNVKKINLISIYKNARIIKYFFKWY